MGSDDNWIALSVSDPGEEELVAKGLSSTHLDLAFIELARHLLATGHGLTYGGDLRLRGFSDQLFSLARSYHLPETAAPQPTDDPDATKRLRSYLAAPLYDNTDAVQLANARNVADVRRVEMAEVDVPASVRGDSRVEQTLALGKMRRVVTDESRAKIILGGKLTGALGRAPGVLEEAWRSVRARQPLFVLGGFAGVGGLIADRLAGRKTAKREANIAADRGYVEMVDRLQGVLPDGEPADGAAMLEEIAAAGIAGLHNGLAPDQNLRLFETDDIDEAIALVLQGLATLE